MVKRGVAASWRGSRCREGAGGGTERGLGGQFYAAFLAGRELQPGGLRKRGWGCLGGSRAGQSLWPWWGLCSPPSISPRSCSCPPPPDCPHADLLPSVGNGDFLAALARGGGAEGRPGLSGAWNLRRGQPRARRRLG